MRYSSDYYTYDAIMQRKMERVSNNLDKREGSVIYTAMAPDSAIDAEIYQELQLRYEEGFADTCSRDYLIRRCAEQGIAPYPATYAVITASFEGASPSIGARFNLAETDINYAVSEIVDGVYYLTCERSGSDGNASTGRLVPILDISGLTSATITSLAHAGEDEEDTEALRKRYFGLFDFQRGFAGNVAGFVEMANDLDGVGATKVIRAWNGGGTCKLIILDETLGIPSTELVGTIQSQIDPTVSDPDDVGGLGMAPIFCKTTVVGATTATIDVVATIIYGTGYDWSACKTAIFNAIDEYFHELIEAWQDESATEVKLTRVMMAILGVTGVSDVSNVTINGGTANIVLNVDQIPITGTVNGESMT